MSILTAHINHLLEQSEAICATRFEQLDKAALEQLTKEEAATTGYLSGFEDALKLLQTMLEEGIEPPKRGEA
jgi:hypothetical protein